MNIINIDNLISVISDNGLKDWDNYGLDAYDEYLTSELERIEHSHALALKYAIENRNNIIHKPGGNQLVQYSASKIKLKI